MGEVLTLPGKLAKSPAAQAVLDAANKSRASLDRARAKLRELNATAPQTALIGGLVGGAAGGAIDELLPAFLPVSNSLVLGAALAVYGTMEDDLAVTSAASGMLSGYVYNMTRGAIQGARARA